jgi:hypothetical protein
MNEMEMAVSAPVVRNLLTSSAEYGRMKQLAAGFKKK